MLWAPRLPNYSMWGPGRISRHRGTHPRLRRPCAVTLTLAHGGWCITIDTVAVGKILIWTILQLKPLAWFHSSGCPNNSSIVTHSFDPQWAHRRVAVPSKECFTHGPMDPSSTYRDTYRDRVKAVQAFWDLDVRKRKMLKWPLLKSEDKHTRSIAPTQTRTSALFPHY